MKILVPSKTWPEIDSLCCQNITNINLNAKLKMLILPSIYCFKIKVGRRVVTGRRKELLYDLICENNGF